jgi:CUB/sushi domain-containing protein
VNINECVSNPCQNGATCRDGFNSFSCVCIAGYSGAFCQTQINECLSNPCLNGASCVDALNRYSCTW